MNNTTCKRRLQKREIIWKQGAKEDLISWEPPSAQRRIHKIFWFISSNEQYTNTQNTNTNKNINTQNTNTNTQNTNTNKKYKYTKSWGMHEGGEDTKNCKNEQQYLLLD